VTGLRFGLGPYTLGCTRTVCADLTDNATSDADLMGRAQLPVQKLLCSWHGTKQTGSCSQASGAALQEQRDAQRRRAEADQARAADAEGASRRLRAQARCPACACRDAGRGGPLKCAVQAGSRPPARRHWQRCAANGKEKMHCSCGHVAAGNSAASCNLKPDDCPPCSNGAGLLSWVTTLRAGESSVDLFERAPYGAG